MTMTMTMTIKTFQLEFNLSSKPLSALVYSSGWMFWIYCMLSICCPCSLLPCVIFGKKEGRGDRVNEDERTLSRGRDFPYTNQQLQRTLDVL